MAIASQAEAGAHGCQGARLPPRERRPGR